MVRPYDPQAKSPQQKTITPFFSMLFSKQSMKATPVSRVEESSMDTCFEPLSPRIGCMGQVKRKGRAGTPKVSLASTPSRKESNKSKYFKLKMIFFRKDLEWALRDARHSRSFKARTCRNIDGLSCATGELKIHVSIEDMDPPLPLTRKSTQKQKEEIRDTIWARRSCSAQLQGLKLPQFQVSMPLLEPVTV